MNGMHLLRGDVRDLSRDLLDADGNYILPHANYFARTTREERAVFAHRHAMYCLPTIELVEWLRGFIGDRTALEIGAGSGVLCKALGIPGVDNYMQTWPEISMAYACSGQPTINYGAHVESCDANLAVRTRRPAVVIGAWITHRYSAEHHDNGGNMYAPDESDFLHHCKHYVHIGHTATHCAKPIMRRDHETHSAPWLYSRAMSKGSDFIAVFRGQRA